MKLTQGPVTHYRGPKKVEPYPHAISPGGASQIGESVGNHAGDAQSKDLTGGAMKLHAGRGYKSPTSFVRNGQMGPGKKSGSQGRY